MLKPAPKPAALISDLQTTGLSRPEIARLADVSTNTIWRLANGRAADPSYSTVRALERLHAERVPKG